MGTDATVDAAIDNYLKHYEKSIGNVWRRTEAGESPEDIAGFRGTSTSDFVRRDLRIIKVMKDPSIESAIWYKLRAARELEELLASDSLDLAVRALLREHVLLLRRAAVGVEVIEERQRRAFIWEELGRLSKERIVRPGDLHRLGVMRGQRGVFRDLKTTKTVAADGVAVSLHHTGRYYPDQFDDKSLIYHFPRTQQSSTDRGEIASLSNAHATGLPVFVVIDRGNLREVRLGNVVEMDDGTATCLVDFVSEVREHAVDIDAPNNEWCARVKRTKEERIQSVTERSARFRFEVGARYGGKCAVTGIGVDAMLDAAHVIEVRDGGPDHPQNGILLLKGFHGAFDSLLWAIHPETHLIVTRPKGPSLSDMGFDVNRLRSDAPLPHPEALEIRWRKFTGEIN